MILSVISPAGWFPAASISTARSGRFGTKKFFPDGVLIVAASKRPKKSQCQSLHARLHIEVGQCTCLYISACNSIGIGSIDIGGLAPAAKDAVSQRRVRKTEILQAISEKQFLPIEVGIAAGCVRFTNSQLASDEDSAWIGRASSVLDLSSGYLSVGERVLQVVPGEYWVNIYCYVPNESALQRLAATSPGWDESLKVVDNLKNYWKLTRQYRCPWNSKSLRRSVAVIVQLLPNSSGASSLGKVAIKECGSGAFALKWTFRTLNECPEMVEPCDWEGGDVDREVPVDVAHNSVKKKPEQSKMSSCGASHPQYPMLFADEALQTFRDALLSRVLLAQRGGKVDAEEVVPRLTAETLKEFDELSEDVSISSRFMLVLACLQIECGYLEEWVAADALVCFPAVERDFRIEFAAASQRKAIKELRMLREEIEEFSG